MTKYETLYGVPVSHFPKEEENIREKLRLVTIQIGEFHRAGHPHTYERQCELHELNQSSSWCRKILEDIEA